MAYLRQRNCLVSNLKFVLYKRHLLRMNVNYNQNNGLLPSRIYGRNKNYRKIYIELHY